MLFTALKHAIPRFEYLADPDNIHFAASCTLVLRSSLANRPD